jgi:hypothetical protein
MRRLGLAVDIPAALGPVPHAVFTSRFCRGMNARALVRACSHGGASAVATRLE